ncbi:MAG TPA: glycoside hydrolase family 44 protein [Anaeromyxobacter sp.]|nr:glycoside hydrolase family 44 protein [Anaeromyxobacter sp.]
MTASKPALLVRVAALLAAVAALLACAPGKVGDGGSGKPPAARGPAITSEPQSVSVAVGQTATFSVTASGSAPLSYQWTRNGVNISGATSPSYTTPAATAADDGLQFRVVVANASGSLTSDPATLSVSAAPVRPSITAQPQSVSVTVGQTATFSVTASGTAPLSYQWTRNGENISGATSTSYTTPATATADNGAQFRVVVTNASGSLTSEPATLTVTSSGGQAFYVYKDGVVASGWSAQEWDGCGAPNMNASFGGGTVASFDLSCAAARDHWDGGVFVDWSGFDLGPYDTLSFDIGAADGTLLSKMGAYLDGTEVQLSGLTGGKLNHVEVPLSELGSPAAVEQLGWQFLSGGTGPVLYVNNVLLSGPAIPVTPPTISALTVAEAEDYTATLTWTTDRLCTGTLTYQKAGGPVLTAEESTLATSHSFTLDSLDPSSTYSVSVVARDRYGNLSSPATVTVNTTAANDTPTVTVTLDPAHPVPISPYIYGVNGLAADSANPPHLTFDRQGGNRLTAYNWENNYSNAGSDWGPFSNDNYMSSSTVPAEAVRAFIAGDRAVGAASLVTVQMQGYVSADGNGLVDMSGGDAGLASRLAARFKAVVWKKSTVSGAAFTVSPPTTDAHVYMDELAYALDQKFSGAGIFSSSPTVAPTFVSLDNEPELWNSTHEEVQGTTPEGSDDYIQRTIALAQALKDQFPQMTIFGPVHYGFAGLWNFQADQTLGGATWFTDKYLKAMKSASDAYGRRLLDVYDFHWYSESYGSARVISLGASDLSDADVQAIVESPRSLWDPTFTDSSDWITGVLGGPIEILPRLKQKIDADYPGTKIAITEYESGGWNHIAGTIAQADDLGIFGSQGVFAAAFWPPGGTYDYALGAFRAYRGFDGGSASFGDVSIPATSSDVSKVAVYASKDSAVSGRFVFVAINRSTATQKVAINGQSLSGTATTYRMTASSAAAQVAAAQHVAPVLAGQAVVSGSSLFAVLPALSVTTIAVQ